MISRMRLMGVAAVVALLVGFAGTGTAWAQTSTGPDCIVDSVVIQGGDKIGAGAHLHIVVVYDTHKNPNSHHEGPCTYTLYVTVTASDKNGEVRDTHTVAVPLKKEHGGQQVDDFERDPGLAQDGGTIDIHVFVQPDTGDPGKGADKKVAVGKQQ